MTFRKLITGSVLVLAVAAGVALGLPSLRNANKGEELLNYHFTRLCDYETGNGSYEISYRIEDPNPAVRKETSVHFRRNGNNWETNYSEHRVVIENGREFNTSSHFMVVDGILYEYIRGVRGNSWNERREDAPEKSVWAPEQFAVHSTRRCKYKGLPAHFPLTDYQNIQYKGRQTINGTECDLISATQRLVGEDFEHSYCFPTDQSIPSMPIFMKYQTSGSGTETWTATDIRNSTEPITKPTG